MIDQSKVRALLGRVEACSGPDREIDFALMQIWNDIAARLSFAEASAAPAWEIPPYTASIAAALALVERVLPGWEFEVSSNHGMGTFDARIAAPDWNYPEQEATAPTPHLAILAALLRAIISTQAGKP